MDSVTSRRQVFPQLVLACWLVASLFVCTAPAQNRFEIGPFDQPEVSQPEASQPAVPGNEVAGAGSSQFTNSPTSANFGGNADPVALTDAVATDANGTATRSDSNLQVTSGLFNVIRDSGLMMIPILGCSILLVMFVFERGIALRRTRIIPKHFVKLFLTELEEGQLKPAQALELCEESKSPISEVFAAAVKKWNRPSVEVEQAVIDAGERVANSLRRYLRLFNGIATISPLLGLLGTVLGMIEAFNAIASSDAMGRPELLAEGISQALLTTAGGLSVAIPAFIAYMYFTSRVDRLIIEIDGYGQEVVGAIASDAWKAKSRTTKSKAA